VTLAAQSMQHAGLISYRRGAIQVLDRPGLKKASCECYAIVKERFDAFLTPPSTAVSGPTIKAGGNRKGTEGSALIWSLRAWTFVSLSASNSRAT
jgi:energy-converting hydrogenase Eha subunit F